MDDASAEQGQKLASAPSSGGKVRWPRSAALDVARELCARLKPVCDRLIVAGSLRRRKAEVGDVEIIYIPRMEERQADLLSTEMVSLADEEIERMLAEGLLTKRPAKTGRTAWGAKNKLALHHSGMPVDLFRTTPEAWWNYLVCRTGPADSNARIATAALRRGYRWNPYGSGFTRLSDGAVTAMESEEAVFSFVGLPYSEPWGRESMEAQMAPEFRDLPALSIRQPWAWLILHAGKDIENRRWQTNFRGRFLIHAAKGCTRAEYNESLDFARRAIVPPLGVRVPDLAEMERGGIVGVAEIVDCVSVSASPWFMGEFGFVLRNIQPLPFLACTGALGFFKPKFSA